jgi:hypothetical protein
LTINPRSPSAPRVLDDRGGSQTHHVECADQVDFDRTGKAVEPMRPFSADDPAGRRHAGAINQTMQMAEFVQRALNSGLAVRLAGDVGFDESCIRTQFGCDGFAGRDIDVRKDDIAAIRDQLTNDGGTEPGTAAGDNENMAGYLHKSAAP